MPIYTKKGDKGQTSLYTASGQKRRVSKDTARIEALGAIDELNSYLGIVKKHSEEYPSEFRKIIHKTQKNLFRISSILAGADLRFSTAKTKSLERRIDKIQDSLPKLESFIISGGDELATRLMFSRSLARRAERRIVSLSHSESVPANIIKYLNRLSDFLFVLSRAAADASGVDEEYWKGNK